MKTCVTCKTTHPKGLFCEHGHVLKEEESEDTLIGRILEERYEVRTALGGGGFGMVYLGAQLRLQDRPCVIKVARPELAKDAQFAARFEREKRALMALRSRNTVQILDYGRTDDAIDYIVMEFIEGDELGHLLRRRGPMQAQRVLAIARGICSSLIEAHGAGILHRDLKPGNVMLVDMGTSELVKVIDFGIARLAGGESDFSTRTGELPGTPAYSPYEQLIGQTRKVDERTDIYSFGAILYEALTGVVPYGDKIRSRDFDSNTLYFLALAQAKAGETPTPPSKLTTNAIPTLFEQLIISMLHKTREERPDSAAEVMEIIQRIERVDAAGDIGIESDDTVMAPLSTGAGASGSRDTNVDAWADSETLDSVPEELQAAPTVPPSASQPQQTTVQPDVPAFTQVKPRSSRGLRFAGGAVLVAGLAVVGYFVLGPTTGVPGAGDHETVSTRGEGPLAANPAGIGSPGDVTSPKEDLTPDTAAAPTELVQSATPVEAEVAMPSTGDSGELPDLVSQPDQMGRADMVIPEVLATPQDATAPLSDDVVQPSTTSSREEDLAEQRRRDAERLERRKMEQKKREEREAAALEEARKAAAAEEKAQEGGAKAAAEKAAAEKAAAEKAAAEKAAAEKAAAEKKVEVKPPPEEKKALHERLDFMDDEE